MPKNGENGDQDEDFKRLLNEFVKEIDGEVISEEVLDDDDEELNEEDELHVGATNVTIR